MPAAATSAPTTPTAGGGAARTSAPPAASAAPAARPATGLARATRVTGTVLRTATVPAPPRRFQTRQTPEVRRDAPCRRPRRWPRLAARPLHRRSAQAADAGG